MLDLSAYPDDGILQSLFLDKLRRGERVPVGRLRRYILDLSEASVAVTEHAGVGFEMPRFNDAITFESYRAIYGNTKSVLEGNEFFDALIKIDPETGVTSQWHEPGTYPSEPIFVARPNARSEDDGLVLSVVRDPSNDRFFVLALDAASFEEVGRAVSPAGVDVPPDFHGSFVFLDEARER